VILEKTQKPNKHYSRYFLDIHTSAWEMVSQRIVGILLLFLLFNSSDDSLENKSGEMMLML